MKHFLASVFCFVMIGPAFAVNAEDEPKPTQAAPVPDAPENTGSSGGGGSFGASIGSGAGDGGHGGGGGGLGGTLKVPPESSPLPEAPPVVNNPDGTVNIDETAKSAPKQ